MSILFIGDQNKNGYSFYQYKVLKNNYSNVDFFEIKTINFLIKIIYKYSWHINLNIYDWIILFYLKKKIKKKYEIVYLHNENLIGYKSIIFLKKISKKLIFYCPDNPFVKRDKKRWDLLKPNLKLFDLIIFMQKNRLKYTTKYKLDKTIWIPPTFKVNEFKRKFILKKKENFKIDVLMIGTWFPERGKLFLKLKQNGINVLVYGNRWKNFEYYKNYKNFINDAINNDDLYVKKIQSSKIAICLPSFENDDDITNKSLEIPYIGSLLLAKDSFTHRSIFKNNVDAVLFKNFDDCLIKVKKLLSDEKKIVKISRNGYEKLKKLKTKLSFEYNIKRIINSLLKV